MWSGKVGGFTHEELDRIGRAGKSIGIGRGRRPRHHCSGNRRRIVYET